MREQEVLSEMVAPGRPAAQDGARRDENTLLRRAWAGALGVFVLAGLTGAFYRYAIAFGGGPVAAWGLDLGNVRHAHSHLMYFGWATPALMALMAHYVRRLTGRRVRGAGLVLGIVFTTALLAFIPFLLYGYRPALIGDARLPLSVMAAGFNVLGWYAFMVVYGRATRDVPRAGALAVFDVAFFCLLLATLGAWGLALLKPLGLESPALAAALTHVFLDLFSEGWFVLGVLGLAYAEAEAAGIRVPRWPVWVAAAGVPFTFALALPAAFVPPVWKVLASVGSVLTGAGLLLAAAGVARRLPRGLWHLALGLLALKAAGQVLVALTPALSWTLLGGFRVLYLHLMLLGFVTLGLVAAARVALGADAARGAWGMGAAVVLLLASLVPLTAVWPAALAGRWVFVFAAAAAFAPVLAAALMALRAATPAPAPAELVSTS